MAVPVTPRPQAVAARRVMTPVPAGQCRRAPIQAPAVAARVMTPVPAGHSRSTTRIRAVVDGAATSLSQIAPGRATAAPRAAMGGRV